MMEGLQGHEMLFFMGADNVLALRFWLPLMFIPVNKQCNKQQRVVVGAILCSQCTLKMCVKATGWDQATL